MKTTETIKSNKWPRDIRNKVNELVGKSNREVIARYDDGIGAPEVKDTDNQIIILIPRPTATTGYTGNLTVCEDDGAGGFTQKTAHFENGLLISVE